MRTSRTTHPSAATLLGLLLVACFSERADLAMGPALTCGQPPPAGITVVEIRNFAFQPDTVRVAAGQTVAWVNCEPQANRNEPHTSTADDEEWNSPFLAIGESFAHRFDATGTFAYFCVPHPFMRGAVIVE